ncbi:hypothetical protein OIDMADRAFT_59971 [Oidiodendron maius Zn]|uniref:Uncharacterized protein n=1 Tax=Oidiodendron maius (strain Zn) TaxID=913774 RepID=A0A0C3C9B9_OIDMZ|nr:hypothetical protein OIDMADRAFT_59971 [Oidiodendron maius Zn]
MPLCGRYFNGIGGLGQAFSGAGIYNMMDLSLQGATVVVYYSILDQAIVLTPYEESLGDDDLGLDRTSNQLIVWLRNLAQLLIAIEPTADNKAPLDLDPNQRSVLSNLCRPIVVPLSYSNLPAPDNYWILPNRSFTNIVSYMGGDHLFHVIVVGNDTLSVPASKELVHENFNTLLMAGQVLDWVAFSIHRPMHAHETPRNIQAGFF